MPHSGSVQPSPGGEAAVDEGAVAQFDDLLGALAAGHDVEAAQDQQGTLGIVASGAARGEFGEPLGAVRRDRLTGVQALPHVLHGLQPQPDGPGFMAGGLRLHHADGLLQLVVVEQGLGQPPHGVHAGGTVQAGHAHRPLEVLDGGGGCGQEGGAAQFVEHMRVHLGGRRLQQGPLQAAAGRFGSADGEVFPGRLAQLFDEFLVVVRVDLEEVPGGRGGAESGVGDDLGGDAVHGGAQGVRYGVVDGGGDQRVHELQLTGAALRRRRVGFGEDAGLAQQPGAAYGVLTAHGGEPGDEVHGDAGAQDGGGPGEAGGVDAEFLEAGDEAAASGGAVQGTQFAGMGLDRLDLAVAHLGEEFDGLVGVSAGDGPHLPAERGVGVRAEGGAGESGGGLRGEGTQISDIRGGDDCFQAPGTGPVRLPEPAGDDDQHGQVVEAFDERGEPAQGLLVGPVGVVDQQHQRPFAPGQPPDRGDQTVAHALRVGPPLPGLRDTEGGAGDVVPVAEVLAGLLGHQRDQRRLQQLPYDVEGDGLEGLAAARRPHGAAALFGDAPGLGQQGGLAQSGLALEDQ
ncbi:hypothetical protein GCM10009549_24070 [Streptomyces thermoalcalitolerans]|uniref:Uncharacterized protein n=1 Tax=Streptomyces thermoalcalitolerans TaxID=65605 RepID=A0ABP3Z098_9ACTN